ncbi:MAG: hypothetical protein A4E55_01990 [Pelotomaculum sp. PtaU1.Bin035]|nr:MAG: hypothetical protein A4E55_01990 [Pelotomaculum sp. PtaU1.Bin035]
MATEIEARSEEIPLIALSADTPAPVVEPIVESKPPKTKITAEEKTELPLAEPAPRTVSKSAPASTEPKSGDRTAIDGKPHVWIPGFGWIVDEGGGSVGTTVGNPGDELTGNKVGVMDGGETVGSKGDIKKQVGIMGGGTVAEDMYENGHKIGIMGGDEPSKESVSPPSEQPEPTGDVIYIELQPTPTKDSTRYRRISVIMWICTVPMKCVPSLKSCALWLTVPVAPLYSSVI